MADMPRQRPPHLQREVNRHGKTVWYVRVGKGPRIRLRAAYGTPEFQAEYDAAVRGDAPARPAGVQTGTLAWLVAQYRETKVWSDLSRATRRQRENIFRHVLESAGKQPFTAITDTAIDKGIDRRKATPAQARHFLDTMRGLFKWAAKAKHVKADPTQGITVAKPKTKGFPVWTPAEIEAYERRWPLGTRERVVFDVYRYTGLRRGDAAIVGKQHVRNGVIVIDTQKTGTRVYVRVLPQLAESLAAGPCGDLSFIATRTGRPFVKEALGTFFAEACRAAGVRKSAHGLRKYAATALAEAGGTVAELEAVFGWEGGRMASLYTRSVDRERLAASGMAKITGTSTPAPDGKVRAKGRKAKQNQ
jgi:integrase